MNKVMKKWVIVGSLIAISASAFAWSEFILPKSLNEQRTEYTNLENRKSVLEAKGSLVQTKVVKKQTGVDMERMENDIKAGKKLLQRVLTWNTGKGYNEMRRLVMREYGLKEGDPFVLTYLPVIEDNVSADGKHYNYIDEAKLNVKYESAEIVLNEVKGNKNEYFAFVMFSSKTKTGEKGYAKSVFLFTVDQAGNLSNLRAYPMYVPELIS